MFFAFISPFVSHGNQPIPFGIGFRVKGSDTATIAYIKHSVILTIVSIANDVIASI